MRPWLQVPVNRMKDVELRELLNCCVATLIGATYQLYDLAIAETVDRNIHFPTAGNGMPTASDLHGYQRALPRLETQVALSWVVWAASTRDNWGWLMEKCKTLQSSYSQRYGGEPPFSREIHKIYMYGPRPRPAGRTPFPEEPC